MATRIAFFLAGLLIIAACDDDPDTPRDTNTALDGVDTPLDTGPAPTPEQARILSIDESEQWVIEDLDAPVHVVRTEANIPHIYASTRHDLYLVAGFVMARDRYAEFELGRRLGLGEISPLLGQDAFAIDQESRGLGRRVVAERIAARLTPEQIEVFDAYAAGINAYIDAVAARKLPPPSEFDVASLLLGKQPAQLMEHVDRTDVAGFIAVIVYQLGFESYEPRRAQVAQELTTAFEGAAFQDLRRAGAQTDIFANPSPVHDVSSAAGWFIEGLDGGSGGGHPDGPGVLAAERFRAPSARVPASTLDALNGVLARQEQLIGHAERPFGSNGWAVAGSATPDGSGILSGDGHLPLGIPSVFYQMGLDDAVFGSGDVHQLGLAFPGLPYLTVGTNGAVAWTQTYLNADITDWYREEIQLDAEGMPAESFFEGAWQPLERIDEVYEIANVPALQSVGRTETRPRFTTFDGRWITAIEGRTPAENEQPGAGESVVYPLGIAVIPEDMDGDGVITAISFDHTGFDISDALGAADGFNRSADVFEWREHTRKLVAYAQNIVVADGDGNISYTGYTAVPCRTYLAREADGTFSDGADPTMLLDGTIYGGFTIPLNKDGTVDETQGDADPYRCVIPFDEYPQSVNPTRGYVMTANNDIGKILSDGAYTNDPHYMGWSFAAGYRARTIDSRLNTLAQAQSATLDEMAALQGDVASNLGLQFSPALLDAISRGRALAADTTGNLSPAEQRIAALYSAESAAIDEVETRLVAWLAAGAQARSGVATFYATPSAQDREDAVATMVFNAWLRSLVEVTFGDEAFGDVWVGNGSAKRASILTRMMRSRGDNRDALASYNDTTGESIFFDIESTPEVETSDEILLIALTRALEGLRAEPLAPGEGGFGTDDMSGWLWGLRHQVRFESIIASFAGDSPAIAPLAQQLSITTDTLPLATDLDASDPRADLVWFPRDGDWFAVDAANPGWGGTRYTYGTGPVMRMVIRLKAGEVTGQNILPGGQSGLTGSSHFSDQAQLWLANETHPMRFHVEDVVEGATGREIFTPQSP